MTLRAPVMSDGDGISEVRDCDDADARILLRRDGVLCHPYEDVFGPLDHLVREADWIGTIQLAGIDTYSVVVQEEVIDNPSQLRMASLNVCEPADRGLFEGCPG